MFGKQCLQKCSQAHITAKFFKRLAKTRLPCYNLIVNFWHSFSNFCNRHTAWATEFVTKLCHCMQANFIYAAEKRLFVFQKCLFQDEMRFLCAARKNFCPEQAFPSSLHTMK